MRLVVKIAAVCTVMLALSSCGDKHAGFISDSNLCRPAFGAYESGEEYDAVESPLELTHASGLRPEIAQKTAPIDTDSYWWGVSLRLSSLAATRSEITVSVATEYDSSEESPILLPDGESGYLRIKDLSLPREVVVDAGWVQLRFTHPLKVAANDPVWLMLKGDNLSTSVNWLTREGVGLMERSSSTADFQPRSGEQARYRPVYCQESPKKLGG